MKVVRHGAPDISSLREQIIDVYESAWGATSFAPTPAQVRDFEAILDRHALQDEFRFVGAHEGDTLSGFAYGYSSVPGGWWRDLVTDSLDPALVEEWFTDCFEFVELAVHPTARERGIGGALHDMLLENLPHRTAALSTQSENHSALRLYNRRGWVVLEPQFMFPNRSYPYTIMGLRLGGGERSTPRP